MRKGQASKDGDLVFRFLTTLPFRINWLIVGILFLSVTYSVVDSCDSEELASAAGFSGFPPS